MPYPSVAAKSTMTGCPSHLLHRIGFSTQYAQSGTGSLNFFKSSTPSGASSRFMIPSVGRCASNVSLISNHLHISKSAVPRAPLFSLGRKLLQSHHVPSPPFRNHPSSTYTCTISHKLHIVFLPMTRCISICRTFFSGTPNAVRLRRMLRTTRSRNTAINTIS